MSATEPLGYSEDGDIVNVRLTRDDFNALLMCLGAARSIEQFRRLALQTANAVNAGRPASEWLPYAVPPADGADEGAG
jgi:hypothetical protein